MAINGIRIVGIPKKYKKDDAVMHYTRVNAKSLVRHAKYCVIFLPFQLTTKRGRQRNGQNKEIPRSSVLYCGTILGYTPGIWYPSVLQAIVSTFWYSKTLKFEIFPSVWRCFFYQYHLVAATSRCRCGQAVIVVSSNITYFCFWHAVFCVQSFQD